MCIDKNVDLTLARDGTMVLSSWKDMLYNFKEFQKYFYLFSFSGSNEESGAQTSIYCALDETITHLSGSFFDNCRLAKETELSRDSGMAKQLWDVSCQATGL